MAMTGLELVQAFSQQPDEEIWRLAVMSAGLAGTRAAMIGGHAEVEQACIEFIGRMHELVGTPAPPKSLGKQ